MDTAVAVLCLIRLINHRTLDSRARGKVLSEVPTVRAAVALGREGVWLTHRARRVRCSIQSTFALTTDFAGL